MSSFFPYAAVTPAVGGAVISATNPMPTSGELGIPLARGDFSRLSIVQKFGRNEDVGTSYEPVTIGGIYRTPQTGSATALRVKAGNANDTAAGSGAREITLVGLDSSGAEVTETLATAGGSASSNSSNSYIRLYRAYVSASGTYATQTTGSHSADIVIENAAGTEDWLTIDSTDFPKGQSEVAAYSVPTGYRAWIMDIHMSVESNKTADVLFFQRTSILQTSAPYDAMRVVKRFGAVAGEFYIPNSILPLGPYAASTDIGFLAKAATTSQVAVDFGIILEDIS